MQPRPDGERSALVALIATLRSGLGVARTLALCERAADAIAGVLGLLQKSRESVRKHHRKHERALALAIKRGAVHLFEQETRRRDELATLLRRIDAALGAPGDA